jgi:hypothetical protein
MVEWLDYSGETKPKRSNSEDLRLLLGCMWDCGVVGLLGETNPKPSNSEDLRLLLGCVWDGWITGGN